MKQHNRIARRKQPKRRVNNNTVCICFFLLLIGSCTHPESKKYERHKGEIDQIESHQQIESEIAIADDKPFIGKKNVLPMTIRNGVRYIWIEINGIKLRFIFDTGASSICISSAEAMVLRRQGTLEDNDFIGTEYFQDATGRISESTKINLRTVKIGNMLLNDIEATIVDNANAPLLLGQSVLERFGRIEIDNKAEQIIFQ